MQGMDHLLKKELVTLVLELAWRTDGESAVSYGDDDVLELFYQVF